MPPSLSDWAGIELDRRLARAKTPGERDRVRREAEQARRSPAALKRLADIAQYGRFQSGPWEKAQYGLAAGTLAPLLPYVGSLLGPVGTGIGTAAALGLGAIGGLNLAEGASRRSEGLPGSGMQMGFGAADVLTAGGGSRLLRGLRGLRGAKGAAATPAGGVSGAGPFGYSATGVNAAATPQASILRGWDDWKVPGGDVSHPSTRTTGTAWRTDDPLRTGGYPPVDVPPRDPRTRTTGTAWRTDDPLRTGGYPSPDVRAPDPRTRTTSTAAAAAPGVSQPAPWGVPTGTGARVSPDFGAQVPRPAARPKPTQAADPTPPVPTPGPGTPTGAATQTGAAAPAGALGIRETITQIESSLASDSGLRPAIQWWKRQALEVGEVADTEEHIQRLMQRGIGAETAAKLLARAGTGARKGGVARYKKFKKTGEMAEETVRKGPAGEKTMADRRPPGPTFVETVTISNQKKSVDNFLASVDKAEQDVAKADLLGGPGYRGVQERLGLSKEGLVPPPSDPQRYLDYRLALSGRVMANRMLAAQKVLEGLGLVDTQTAARIDAVLNESFLRAHHSMASTGRRTIDVAGTTAREGRAGQPMQEDMVEWINSLQEVTAALGMLFAGIFTAQQMMPGGPTLDATAA